MRSQMLVIRLIKAELMFWCDHADSGGDIEQLFKGNQQQIDNPDLRVHLMGLDCDRARRLKMNRGFGICYWPRLTVEGFGC